MIQFEEAILGLSNDVDSMTISKDENDDDNASTRSSITAVDSTPHDYKVKLDQQYVSSTVESSCPKVGSNDFDSLCVLGRGAFGKVLLVKHRASRTLYAMKTLKKASLVLHVNNIKTERQILEQVRHPFIVQLYYAFQTPTELHMILEYAVGGELFRYLDQEGMFSEPMASFYAAELVLALSHLHSLGIVYRDLKPENCLLDQSGHILLTDFGLSKVSLDGKTNTICGTAEYMAPEVLAGLQYDYSVDWWSLGILIYDMLTGSPPFKGNNRQKTIDGIMSKKPAMPYYFTNEAKSLLTGLLRKNPHVRLGAKPKGADAIRKHRFFRKIDWKALSERHMDPPIVPLVVSYMPYHLSLSLSYSHFACVFFRTIG
ncbi:kinase-like domain-containing protein [Zychaea mexicana]|uniref:kinase-like domain-containing protein n=1 Tax=Zychaea mexicana TaxID=64656 RepID=UPI0022FDD86B|nr:kinase-like domain-containing protein [Zychaea mexicana]KAI9492227.1 kinase-like domain-containing protein [Zychaea mexicana]